MSSDRSKTTLGMILSLEYGKSLPDRDRDDKGPPVYGSNGVVGHHSKPLVSGPGIVVGRKGTAGSVTWSDEDFFPIDTTYWVRLKDPEGVNLRFASLLLESANLPNICAQTGVPGLNRDRAYEVAVVVPPLAEQRRIVDLIGAFDAQIKALGTEKNDMLTLRSILMSHHVAGCGSRSSLGTFVDVAQGRALPKGRQGVTSGPVPWFKIADMTGAGNHFGYNRADTSMTPAEIAALRGKILPVGSVVFPRVGAAVLTEKKRLLEVEGAVDENHLVLLPRPGTDSEYLLALIEWVHLSELVQSGAVPSLNMSLIRNLDVPIADPETQRALGCVLGHLRLLGRALSDEIGAARALRSITLTNVLSGECEIAKSYHALLGEAV